MIYNDEGRLASIIYYTAYGTVAGKQVYQYNSGKIQKSIIYEADGTLFANVEYNDEGMPVYTEYYNLNTGTLGKISYEKYKKDATGNIISYTDSAVNLNLNDTIVCRMQLEYDKQGRLKEVQAINSRVKENSIIRYIYQSGVLIREEVYYSVNEPKYVVIHQYYTR